MAEPVSGPVRPRLVLVGAPGAGKTTVGHLVAAELGVAFRDTDADVEVSAGKSVAEIFVEDGEAAFREREQAAVGVALAGHDGVLALGGGAVLAPATRAALVGHAVVFLDVGLAAAARRVGFNRDRPLLIANPRATLKRLMDERRPLYLEVAQHTVAADGEAEDVTAAVLAAIGAPPRPAGAPVVASGGSVAITTDPPDATEGRT